MVVNQKRGKVNISKRLTIRFEYDRTLSQAKKHRVKPDIKVLEKISTNV